MSTTSSIQATTTSSYDYSKDTTTEKSNQTLGQDEFLQLLVAQLSSQDPLNPQTDTEFIAQMAQFSSLEQSKAIQTEIAQLRADQQMTQAESLLGQTVRIDAGTGTTVTGTVQAVQVEDGTPKLSVNGVLYNLSQVVAISTPIQTQS